jgi:citrate lyase subunit gamma (acyl carrier protein)
LRKVEATAGTSDRGDVFIRVRGLKSGSGIDISLESRVKSLYEEAILETIKKKLKELKVSDMRVEIEDQAAFDYVIKARLETAVQRAIQAGKKGQLCLLRRIRQLGLTLQ